MGEYFKGWKRKIGLVTLLTACLFTVGWVRSLLVPYYSVVFGLAALSAFLLLSKPRPSAGKKSNEPIPENVA